MSAPAGLAVDAKGNLYIADSGNFRVRVVNPAGVISTVAGNGISAGGGDGAPATIAPLTVAGGLAVDAAGNLYIGTTAKVRKVDASTGIISTIAGTGTSGFSGDGGPASLAAVNNVTYIALDAGGNIYFTDASNQRIRRLSTDQIVPGSVLNGAIPARCLRVKSSPSTAQPSEPGDSALHAGQPPQRDCPLRGGWPGHHAIANRGDDNNTNTLPVPVAATAPGVFTQDQSGKGPAMVLNADGTLNSQANPAAVGSMVTISAAGEGQTNPIGIDGLIASDTPPVPVAPVSVQIGGMDAPVMSAGGVSGQPDVTVSVQAPTSSAARSTM